MVEVKVITQNSKEEMVGTPPGAEADPEEVVPVTLNLSNPTNVRAPVTPGMMATVFMVQTAIGNISVPPATISHTAT